MTKIDWSKVNNMSVCPHDTAKNVHAWFLLNAYLQRRLAARIRFSPQDNFLQERESVLASEHHLVYANPYSAVIFGRHGFVPVARPVGIFDETLVVAHSDTNPAMLPRRPRIASATDKLIIHNLGLALLPELGLDPAGVEFVFAGNHLAAAKAVVEGKAHLGFVFNETWNGLSKAIRSELKVLTESKEGCACHCFLVGPSWASRADEVRSLLCAMTRDPRGHAILVDLRFEQGFEHVPSGMLAYLANLMHLE
ncbi:MAG TPA: PhnD/SsuA/transferrin family substrate-binding protein [Rhodocyclaceae bacterium]|nr:PhnD/SsuA/transferrin family substrate-binding protein [Rhodocyclaceae bacterium]